MYNLVVADVDRGMGRIVGRTVEDQVSRKEVAVLDHGALLVSLLLHGSRRTFHLVIRHPEQLDPEVGMQRKRESRTVSAICKACSAVNIRIAYKLLTVSRDRRTDVIRSGLGDTAFLVYHVHRLANENHRICFHHAVAGEIVLVSADGLQADKSGSVSTCIVSFASDRDPAVGVTLAVAVNQVILTLDLIDTVFLDLLETGAVAADIVFADRLVDSHRAVFQEVIVLTFDLDPFVARCLSALLEEIVLAVDLLLDLLQHSAILTMEEVIIVADLCQAFCQRAVVLRVVLFAAFLEYLVVVDNTL